MNKINFFDIHSHLHSTFFNKKEDGQNIAKKMKKRGIYSTIIGVNYVDSKKAIKMVRENTNLSCSIGIHPNEKEKFDDKKFQKLIDENKKEVVCVGECGLDYYWISINLGEGIIDQVFFDDEIIRQKKLFENQIDFAIKNNLPLMLHIRSFENGDAHLDAFRILDKKQVEFQGKIRANFHFFTESSEIVDEIIKRGFHISLPGVITFADLDESVKKIPMEFLMSETDSPYATPKPYRGKTNTPIYIDEIVKKIAKIKNISELECRKTLVNNALIFFKINF